jgi:hypothetical protein
MVFSFGRELGLPVDSLMSYINEEFMNCCRRYDPDKCTASPEQFVQYQLRMRILDFRKKQRRKRQITVDSDIDTGSGLIPEKSEPHFLEVIHRMVETQDAREFLNLILSMCDDPIAKKRSQSDKFERAVRIAQDTLNWSESRISRALAEIRSSYSVACQMV